MTGRSALERFLRTDPRDVGCAKAMEMLHIYAELAAAGGPAEGPVRSPPPAPLTTCDRYAGGHPAVLTGHPVRPGSVSASRSRRLR